MWINIKTEYSFRQVYGHLNDVATKCSELGNYGGIADLGNTFSHIPWKQACEKVGIKPIYGVILPVVEDPFLKERRIPVNNMTFIAKTSNGLQEIYALVELSHDQFYYKQRISYDQINQLSNDIAILSGVAPKWDLIKRHVYQEIGPHIPICNKNIDKVDQASIACIDNYYPNYDDKAIYEPFADERLRERRTYPIHILSKEEWISDFPDKAISLINLYNLANHCNADLKIAPMVKYLGSDNIEVWCKEGSKKRNINLNEDPYKSRYSKEINLIADKGYVDYFLVVADLIRYAKTKMIVGPSRGSSAGSLVCYLMGITEIDPLIYDLYFERFIDLNRSDMPDIDIDFQDNKRHLVLKYLEKKYGKNCVAQIGNINKLKPKSAITRFAKSLNIPLDEIEILKDSIMERSMGDARANLAINDTINDTDVGKKFIKKYPQMKSISKIESHASHAGIHAAGILVCNDPINIYAGINSRDNKRIAMLDKKTAESIGLLKIDALGLRTLSILASVCDQINKSYNWLYDIPLNDELTYKVFNDKRYNGIFQFEGQMLRSISKRLIIENIEDISALGALCRPGPMNSGGTDNYIKFKSGEKKVEYISNHKIVVDATESTYGVVVYQEQVMKIVRDLGKLSWKETSAIRKAMSGSLGIEFFNKMYLNFEKGCVENKLSKEESKKIWDHINTMGSWSFNKSHAVSYGLISYLCAYMKAHYPLEFTVACLNNAKDDKSALKILRDSVEFDNIKYKYIDKYKSVQDWSVQDGILYGGLKTIHGIGPIIANKIVNLRKEKKTYPFSIQKKLELGISEFKYLYPGRELYGDFYSNPQSHNLNRNVSLIKDISKNGNLVIIGCLIGKQLRDANETYFIIERNGQYETGQTNWLNIKIEDDTETIMCKIQKKNYLRIGKEIADTGKVDKDWYIIYGEKIKDWGLIFVKNIMKITREI